MQIQRLSFRDITGDMPVLIGKKGQEFTPGGRFKGEPPPPPPPPTFSEEQFRNAERESYKKGFLEGTQDGIKQTQSEQADIERKLSETAEKFAFAVHPIFENYRQMALACREETPKLAMAIARKVAGAALSDNAQAAVEEVALRCVETMTGEPGLVVTVHESLAKALEQKLAAMAAKSQTPLDVAVMGDPAIGIADCRVEWKKGALARQTDQLWQEIERAIASLGASAKHDTNVSLDALAEKLPEKPEAPPEPAATEIVQPPETNEPEQKE